MLGRMNASKQEKKENESLTWDMPCPLLLGFSSLITAVWMLLGWAFSCKSVFKIPKKWDETKEKSCNLKTNWMLWVFEGSLWDCNKFLCFAFHSCSSVFFHGNKFSSNVVFLVRKKKQWKGRGERGKSV